MYKVAIIGCGNIASAHAKAVRETEGMELLAVCDVIKEKADKFAAEHNVKKVYYDFYKVLEDKEVDIVAICTPSGMHGEMVVAAAKANKHIMCEKPMEINHQKLDAIIDAIDKYKIKMACVFQRRVQQIPIKVKKALDSGIFGKVLVADAYLKYYRSSEYYKSADWRATWELDGGGALMNQGIHGLDLINWLMGGAYSVYALCKAQLHNIAVEDTALCVVKYKNGAVGMIEGATCIMPGQETRFEIHCENGSIIFNDSGIKSWFLNGKEEADGVLLNSEGGTQNDPKAIDAFSHTPLYEDLLDAIKNNKKPLITSQEGREAVDVILAIYKSSKENREVLL